MRTTITIDDDIIKQIEFIAKRDGRPRRDVLNDTLRHGLKATEKSDARKTPFRTASKNLGRCLIPSLDNVAEVLAVAEGDDFS